MKQFHKRLRAGALYHIANPSLVDNHMLIRDVLPHTCLLNLLLKSVVLYSIVTVNVWVLKIFVFGHKKISSDARDLN